jgi:hypothetical protein
VGALVIGTRLAMVVVIMKTSLIIASMSLVALAIGCAAPADENDPDVDLGSGANVPDPNAPSAQGSQTQQTLQRTASAPSAPAPTGICDGDFVRAYAPNHAFASFITGAAPWGTKVSFPDGEFSAHDPNAPSSPSCFRVRWTNVSLVCDAGTWKLSGAQQLVGDDVCGTDLNEAWTDGTSRIKTGYDPTSP